MNLPIVHWGQLDLQSFQHRDYFEKEKVLRDHFFQNRNGNFWFISASNKIDWRDEIQNEKKEQYKVESHKSFVKRKQTPNKEDYIRWDRKKNDSFHCNHSFIWSNHIEYWQLHNRIGLRLFFLLQDIQKYSW